MATGSVAREGPGETRPEPTGRRADRHASTAAQARRRERRERESRSTRGGGPDRAIADRSRRVSGTCRRSPWPPAIALDAVSRPRPDSRRRPTGPRSTDHVRLLLAWTGAINLTAIRDPVVAMRRTWLDSLVGRALLAGHAGRAARSTSAAAAASRACRWRSPSRLGSDAARRLDRQEGALPRGPLWRRSASRIASRSTTARAEALAADDAAPGTLAGCRPPARSASLDVLVELAFPLLCAGRRRSSPGSGGAIDAELAAAGRAAAALAGGARRGPSVTAPRPRRPRPGRRDEDRSDAGRLSARPGRARPPTVVSAAPATLPARCGSPSCRTSTRT